MNHIQIFKNNKIVVFDSAKEMMNDFIKRWEKSYNETIQNKKYFHVALSGGNTPKPFYEKIAKEIHSLSWQKIQIFVVDERFVPYHHPDSNFGMIKASLLDHIPIPNVNVHPIPIEETVHRSAEQYEKEIIRHFHLKPEKFPSFDLMILGLGIDGHIASLFPGNPVLNEKKRLVLAVYEKEIQYKRISITLPVINQSQTILFLILGKSKAERVCKIVRGENPNLPVSHVFPKRGKSIFLLDREAASQLNL